MSSTIPPPAPVGRLLDEIGTQYSKPDPRNFALKARRFENVLSAFVFPFVGINAFIGGSVAMRMIHPPLTVWMMLGEFAALFVVAAFVLRRHLVCAPVPALFLGALPTLLTAALLMIEGSIVAQVLIVIATFVFVVSIYSSAVPQTAAPGYFIYFPILLISLQPEWQYRLPLEFLVLIPAGVAFTYRKLRIATFGVVAGAVLTALIESDTSETAVVILLTALVLVAVWYEIRIARSDYSQLRMLVDQTLAVALMYLAVQALGLESDDASRWLWAGIAVSYQALRVWRERLTQPTRLVVAGAAIVIATWAMEEAALTLELRLTVPLLVVGILNAIALRLGNTFVATCSLGLLLPGAVRLFTTGSDVLSPTIALATLLTAHCARLVAQRPEGVPGLPWWSGFAQTRHVQWTKGAFLTIGSLFLKIPFAAALFGAARSALLWLRYFKGEKEPFALTDLFYTVAHVFAVTIMSWQAELLAASQGASTHGQLAAAMSVWVMWGLGLFATGWRNHAIYPRILGMCLLATPLVLYFPAITDDDTGLALAALITGTGCWVIGILKRVARDGDGGP